MKRLIGILAVVATLVMTALPLFAGTVAAAPPGNTHFNATWQRTDKPVADLIVDRTWVWGPEGRTDLLTEPYAESPGGQRTVQYFDKSRMEITHPGGDPDSIWYVTNGLLVVELITGRMQLGDNLFEDRLPAEVPVAGDRDDADGPTYATFGSVLDAPATPVGDALIERLSRSGQVTSDPSLLARDVRAAHFDEVTGHSVAAPFWAFMNSTGTVYQDGQFGEDLLFADALFGTGRPISEAYWANVKVGGTSLDVLMQCFERRCLTYNPANAAGWQVEAGNVGIHYYEWRYETEADPGQDPAPGDPPPGDPPPGDPPGDPPPGDPPPGDPPAGEAPVAPTNLSAEVLLDDDVPYIALTWDDQSDDEDGFRLYAVGEGATTLIAEVGANVESYANYDFADLNPRGGCWYVEAHNDYGNSAPSDTACAVVPDEPLAGPTLISPASNYISYDREIEFMWEPVTGVNGMVLCVLKPEYGNLPCDFNLDGSYGFIIWMSGTDTIASGSTTQELPEDLVSDGSRQELVWSVSACAMDAYHCRGAGEWRSLTVDLTVPLTAPNLRYVLLDTYDPARATFYWDLVPGAERYIVCVAAPGASCEHETGDFLKSALLGPTVDAHVVDIPLWLAPDGQVTELRWTVAACDVELNCVWSQQIRSVYVDRIPDADLEPAALTDVSADPTDPARLTFTWTPSPGAERYVICLISANTGGHCKWEVGDWYKSAILGPTVTSHTMQLPIWLAPEGEETTLFAQVAACDINLACAWPDGYYTVIVDRA